MTSWTILLRVLANLIIWVGIGAVVEIYLCLVPSMLRNSSNRSVETYKVVFVFVVERILENV